MLCVYCITKTVSVVPDPLVGYMYRCYTVPVRRRLDQSSVCNYVCSGCAVQFSNLKLICSCSCSPIHCSSVDTIAASLCSVCCVETLWAESLISHLYCIQMWSLHNKLMVLVLVPGKCINFVDLWLWQVMWNVNGTCARSSYAVLLFGAWVCQRLKLSTRPCHDDARAHN